MKNFKVFVSVVPFGTIDKTPILLLKETGWDIEFNPLNRKLKNDELAQFANDADAIIASTENLDRLIDKSNNLKLISRVGIGLDNIPFQRCQEKKIKVHYTPDAVTVAVAEIVIGSMISLTRSTFIANNEIRNRIWQRHIGKSMTELKIGVLGYGRIGQALVDRLLPFQPEEILIHDIIDQSALIAEKQQLTPTALRLTTFEDLMQNSDVVSIHIPLNKANRYLISQKEIDMMKDDAYLINYSRGELINEMDLIDALQRKKLAGVAIDVFEHEPYLGALKHFKNALLTSHMGSCSCKTRKDMEMQSAQAVINFFTGQKMEHLIPESDYQLFN